MRLIDLLFGRGPSGSTNAKNAVQPTKSNEQISFDNSKISYISEERDYVLSWSELSSIRLKVSERSVGHETRRVLTWLLGCESTIFVDDETEGMTDLIEEFMKLPSFDKNALIAALEWAGGERQWFLLWRAPEIAESII